MSWDCWLRRDWPSLCSRYLLPGFLRLPLRTARPLGFLCLALVAGVLALEQPAGRRSPDLALEVAPSDTPSALAQIGVSAADWVFSGAALYVLLPHRVPFHVFFAVFLLGQIAALVAQVPAGLGVFEAVMLWSLRPAIPVPALLIGLIGYRLVYFLLPLLLATGLWIAHEVHRWYRKSRPVPRRRAAASH